MPDIWMRDDDLRVFLEDRRDHQERQVLLGVIDPLERVRHDHIDAPAEQQLRGILLRPALADVRVDAVLFIDAVRDREIEATDRKSTRLNSSHLVISYAVFCLK